jgi:lambda repressor-like predicted transcriptional regulator
MRRYSNWTLWSKWISRLPKVSDRATGTTLRKRQRVVKLSPEQVADLITAYQDGQTVYDLAARFNIHRVTVSAHLHRHGIPLRRQGLDRAGIDHAARLYTEGTSLARIGTRFNVDAHTIRTALKARGIPMRDTHGRDR